MSKVSIDGADDNHLSNVFVCGTKKDASSEELQEKIERVFLKASDQLSWLTPGDKVLLKPALNSGCPFPATTHPQTVWTISELLRKRGAEVFIGDQSGIQYVVQDSSGIVKGSSRKTFDVSGMGKGVNAEFIAFEEEGWEDGYFKHQLPRTSSWPKGFYITKWVNKVDHIINLPRLSTHVISGVTLGFKNMVGLLREDSRLDFHANGPYNFLIKILARKSNLVSRDDHTNSFFEKMTEITSALQEKLRVILFTGTKAQATLGPDKYLKAIANRGIGLSCEVTPETGLVFASPDPLAAEVFALAFLTHLYLRVPLRKKLLHKIILFFNTQAKELGKKDIWSDPFVSHALNLGLGNGSIRTYYEETPIELQNQLNRLITDRSEGVRA